MSDAPLTDLSPLTQIQNAARELVEAGQTDEAFELFGAALGAVLRRNAELELLLKKLRAKAAGKSSSEKLDPEQLSLLLALVEQEEHKELDLEQEAAADVALDKEIDQARQQEADAQGEGKPPKRRRCKAIKTEGLEQRDTFVPVPADKADWEVIGYKILRRLRFSPAHFYLELLHQPVLKAPELSEQGMEHLETVAAPPTLVPHGTVGDDVLAMLVVRKFEEHMPLHRLHRQFLREQGIDLPVSTLAQWVCQVGMALQRLMPPLLAHVLSSFVVQTDATGLRVMDVGPPEERSPEGVHRGTFYAYVGYSGKRGAPCSVVFMYTPTGEPEQGPWAVLKGREGDYIQADALNHLDRLFNGKVTYALEVGCHFHARRNFVACDTDPRSAYPLQLIQRLFKIEELADARGYDADERLALRRSRSKPVMDKLLSYFTRQVRDNVPTDPVRKASQYYLNHWVALTRFLEDGRLELTNNRVEREFRAFRLGEHNWLFAGSDDAAARMGAIMSVLSSAKSHGLDLHSYLTDILHRLAYPMSAEQVADLLPHRYKARLDQAAADAAAQSAQAEPK